MGLFVASVMRTLTLLLGAALAGSLLAGCNIVRGVGQDMAAVGRTVAKVSDPQGRTSDRSSPAGSVAPADDDYEYGWQD